MTKYFSLKKNTNYTLTVSKSGYTTHTETINISADTTKNITLTPDFTPETVRFDYTGAVQTYTVPQGTTKLIVDCVGAAGNHWSSSSISSSIGKGGRVQCKLTVTAGQSLNIYVGGSNGWNGGGTSTYGATGGGASDIRIGGTSLNNRKVVAGGSGVGYTFGDWNMAGGYGGGLVGGNGNQYDMGTVDPTVYTGKGGTQTSGGKRGVPDSPDTQWKDGSFGQGGSTTYQRTYGCPGGGGWYGGGCGCSADYGLPCGSGGGGSSYTDPNLCSNVTHTQGYSSATGNGWIIITTSNE